MYQAKKLWLIQMMEFMAVETTEINIEIEMQLSLSCVSNLSMKAIKGIVRLLG